MQSRLTDRQSWAFTVGFQTCHLCAEISPHPRNILIFIRVWWNLENPCICASRKVVLKLLDILLTFSFTPFSLGNNWAIWDAPLYAIVTRLFFQRTHSPVECFQRVTFFLIFLSFSRLFLPVFDFLECIAGIKFKMKKMTNPVLFNNIYPGFAVYSV